MPGIKIVIGGKDGKCVQKEVSEENAPQWYGKKVGDHFKGEMLDLAGYEFQITGGSDNCGFPMRWDVSGPGRKKILAVKGVGLKMHDKGVKVRRTVCGSVVSERTAQINAKITKAGHAPLVPPAAEEKKE